MHPATDRRSALLGFTGIVAAATASAALGQPTTSQPGRPGWGNKRPDPSLTAPSMRMFDTEKGVYVLPPLPYDRNALEPHIDARTIELHHGKIHSTHVQSLNRAVSELNSARQGQGDPSLIKHWSRELAFHGSGHFNHTLAWNLMAPTANGGGSRPEGPLAAAIERDFGSWDAMLSQFKAAAAQVEGGGWTWLTLDRWSNRLTILQLENNQDSHLTNAAPIMGVDVWEHAYFLKYDARRTEYIEAFIKVANWKFAGILFEAATLKRD